VSRAARARATSCPPGTLARVSADDRLQLQGNRAVHMAPDGRPAVRMRTSLLDSQWRLGLDFDQASEDGLADALRALDARERAQWRDAFEATREQWRAACYGQWATAITLDLLD
jgi:hypothetical protein